MDSHLMLQPKPIDNSLNERRVEMPIVLKPGYRLLTSVVIAALTFLLSASLLDTESRIVLAWDIGVSVLLILISAMMWRSTPHETQRRARDEETSNIVLLIGTIGAVAGAFVAITKGQTTIKAMPSTFRLFYECESVAAVILAWLLIHMMYSLHYAKLYYVGRVPSGAKGKGLTFPGDTEVVDYWDFVYYSFTIAMCFQTSDVMVMSPYLRRLTIFHAIVSYFFAFAILGLLLDGFFSNLI
jgi:uncharacterized membrane protein